MKENIDGMTIRLVGCALAILLLAGASIYTGLFAKAAEAADVHAAVIRMRGSGVARGGVVLAWVFLGQKNTSPREEKLSWSAVLLYGVSGSSASAGP